MLCCQLNKDVQTAGVRDNSGNCFILKSCHGVQTAGLLSFCSAETTTLQRSLQGTQTSSQMQLAVYFTSLLIKVCVYRHLIVYIMLIPVNMY